MVYGLVIFIPLIFSCEVTWRCIILLYYFAVNIIFLCNVITLQSFLYVYIATCWWMSISHFLCSGRLYRLVSGLPEVPGAAGWAGAAEVRSVLWLHPGQLQPGTECGPQPHVVPQLWPGPQRLRGAHLFWRRTNEQGGGCHLVQTCWPPRRGPVLLCLTVGWRERQGQGWCI